MITTRFVLQPLACCIGLGLAVLFIARPLPATAAPGAQTLSAPAGAVRWDLAPLYATPEAWAASLKKAREQAPALA